MCESVALVSGRGRRAGRADALDEVGGSVARAARGDEADRELQVVRAVAPADMGARFGGLLDGFPAGDELGEVACGERRLPARGGEYGAARLLDRAVPGHLRAVRECVPYD